jgi:hypothetical protein
LHQKEGDEGDPEERRDEQEDTFGDVKKHDYGNLTQSRRKPQPARCTSSLMICEPCLVTRTSCNSLFDVISSNHQIDLTPGTAKELNNELT